MLRRTPEKTTRGWCGGGTRPRVTKYPTRRRWLLLLLSTKETRSPRSGGSLVCGGTGTKQTTCGGLRPARTCRGSKRATTRRGLSIPPAAKETATALRLVLLRRIAKEAPAGLRLVLVLEWPTAKKGATGLTRILRVGGGGAATKGPTACMLSPGIGSTKKASAGLTRILRARRCSVAAKGSTARLLGPRISSKKTWADTLALRSTGLGAAKHRRLSASRSCVSPSIGPRAQSTEKPTALTRLLLSCGARISKDASPKG